MDEPALIHSSFSCKGISAPGQSDVSYPLPLPFFHPIVARHLALDTGYSSLASSLPLSYPLLNRTKYLRKWRFCRLRARARRVFSFARFFFFWVSFFFSGLVSFTFFSSLFPFCCLTLNGKKKKKTKKKTKKKEIRIYSFLRHIGSSFITIQSTKYLAGLSVLLSASPCFSLSLSLSLSCSGLFFFSFSFSFQTIPYNTAM